MSLTTTLKPLFDSVDRKRGVSYFESGAVSSLTVDDNLLLAEVQGLDYHYDVVIDVMESLDDTLVTCTCPRFEKGVYCKHIWAAILEYDSTHGAKGLAGAKPAKSAVRRKKVGSRRKTRPKIPLWQTLLKEVAEGGLGEGRDLASPFMSAAAPPMEIHYVIDAGDGNRYEPPAIQLCVFHRNRKVNGEWGKLKPLSLSHDSNKKLTDSVDQKISALLMGADRNYTDPYGYQMFNDYFSKFELDSGWPAELCELLVESGRLHWTLGMELPLDEFMPVEFINFETPAEICIEMLEQAKPKNSALMEVSIKSNGRRIDNNDVVKIAENGTLLLTKGLMKIANEDAIGFWTESRDCPDITIKKSERVRFLKALSKISGLPHIKFPDSWEVREPESVSDPTAVLKLDQSPLNRNQLKGLVYFEYGENGEKEFQLHDASVAIYDVDKNAWSKRNLSEESKLIQRLSAFPITENTYGDNSFENFSIHKKYLVKIVDELGCEGWKVLFSNKEIKQAGEFNISVESGQDWFDLSAEVSFDAETIALPSLLQAISKKEDFITLADGSRGRIPAAMIEKYARLAKFGKVEDDKIRFRPSQAMLLDAMLDAKKVSFDKGFQSIRKKLKSFTGIKPKSPPRGFQGALRKYQSEGLGWLHFLREFHLGGCLADDMGLGKTIQVLSLLESRRVRKVPVAEQKSNGPAKVAKGVSKGKTKSLSADLAAANFKRKPSIVVVPKSLIFNWIEEAAKFTPRLKIVNYTGTDRRNTIVKAIAVGEFDVLLTTYGTMRKDISELSQINFDYAILDESQAIKNSKAQCAKSSRLIRADHRLAMTGTPIENHLGELWSLFEFLNPGMLGGSKNFATLTKQKKNNEEEREATLAALSRAIQPFMLRRTKEQVLTDLPPKTEQTLYCDMLPSQKKAYDELKAFYRVKLAKKVETDGIARSKIQVLEALLRLRQVACDPRLLDKNAKPGAKLELLGQQLSEVVSEGHKVLIFSQFTSFLSLVKDQFDAAGICYEYLDGKSSKRSASVKRFQEDKSVSAFLISIKAGGHGLNLTAADYVYLLDPWWNPAVEAQAIDRAHRMGQQNPVIAYRMICRDTVEEKILSLQNSKRDLAEKVIRSDESLIRSMTADDLQILFE